MFDKTQMKNILSSFVKKYKTVIVQAVPSILAIIIVEIVNIEVYIQGTFTKASSLLVWVALQTIPGLIFSYISDCYFRKATLIICQILGLFGGIILSIFGFQIWVLALLALTFNPVPVARAAFLDNFPQHSRLKLMAITFLAQFGPLVFHNFLTDVTYNVVITWVLVALAINIILTIFLFHDNYDKTEKKKNLYEMSLSSILSKVKHPLIFTISAFVCAEMTFYLLWQYLEYDTSLQSWLSIATGATIIGIFIAMLYTKLPHFSTIRLFYSVGFAMTLIGLLHCFGNHLLCGGDLINSMTRYAVIGGLYLPFVADAVLGMTGPKFKALGSAAIELAGLFARLLAAVFNSMVIANDFSVLMIIVILYLAASGFQRLAERGHKKVA